MPALAQGVWFMTKPVDCFERCRRRYGDPFTLRLPSSPVVVMFSDPAAIREIFTADDALLSGGEGTAILRPILGPNSLLLLDGERHLRERRMMLPPFHGDRMLAYGETMREVTERALASWPTGRSFRLLDETQQITLDVILRTVFGLEDGAAMAELRALLQRFVGSAVNPIYLWSRLQVDLGPWSPWGRFLRLRGQIDALLDAEIAACRADGGAPRNDVLHLLVAARDEDGRPMTDAQLRDELMTLLLAGHETTATALAWTMHRALTEEGVYDRIRSEIGSATRDGRVVVENLGSLEYLDAVIKETLR
jgi:cytochrome P450